ncbi:MAG: hypothetical protein WAT39_05705 [Planctomycetota bacterium]
MGTRSSAVVAAIVPVGAWCALVAGATVRAQDPVVRAGAHFAVHLHAGTKVWPAVAARMADEAQKSAEAAWPVIDELLGCKPAKPLVLHVWADEPVFREKEKLAATGAKIPIESFADYAAGEAHLLLWPILSAKATEIVGLPEPTRQALIARAAQLVAAQHAPFVATDPWLYEVFGWAVLEAVVNPTHQFGLDPAYDTRRYKLWHKLESRQDVLLQPMIMDFDSGTTRAEYDDDEGAKCMIARMLAMTGKGWAKKLFTKPGKKVTTRGEIRGHATEKAFGSDWLKNESAFTKHCQTIRPQWRETAPMAGLREQRLLTVGTAAESMQIQAIGKPPAQGDYRVTGNFEILPCGEDSFRIQLDWTEDSMIGCFFGVGKWRIEMWKPGNDWQKLAEGKAPIFPRKRFDATVEVGKQIRVVVDGQVVGTWDQGARLMRGWWSFGVNDCVVWIDKLRLESAAGGKR